MKKVKRKNDAKNWQIAQNVYVTFQHFCSVQFRDNKLVSFTTEFFHRSNSLTFNMFHMILRHKAICCLNTSINGNPSKQTHFDLKNNRADVGKSTKGNRVLTC
jgi:hypothetical protein